MDRGYVFLWRKLIDNPVMANPKALSVFIYCLLRARMKPATTVLRNSDVVSLDIGELAAGRAQIAERCGLSEQEVRTALNYLETKCQILTSRTTNRGSILRLCNFGFYQCGGKHVVRLSNQQLTSSQPAANQQLTTNKTVEDSLKTEEETDTYSTRANAELTDANRSLQTGPPDGNGRGRMPEDGWPFDVVRAFAEDPHVAMPAAMVRDYFDTRSATGWIDGVKREVARTFAALKSDMHKWTVNEPSRKADREARARGLASRESIAERQKHFRSTLEP